MTTSDNSAPRAWEGGYVHAMTLGLGEVVHDYLKEA